MDYGKTLELGDYLKDQSSAAALNVAKAVLKGGGLKTIGKAILAAALDSYVPGLSGMLGLTDGADSDPFAAHAAQILERIDAAEENILNQMSDFWAEMRSMRDADIRISFETLRSSLRRWETEYTAWGQLALPQLYTDAVDGMGAFLVLASEEIAHKYSSVEDAQPPYPYLHHLDTFAQMTQLQLLNAPKHAYIVASHGMGVVNEPTYREASAERLAQIDAMAAVTATNAVENALRPAFALASALSDADPFRERVEWMFHEADDLEVPRLYSYEYEAKNCHGFEESFDKMIAHGWALPNWRGGFGEIVSYPVRVKYDSSGNNVETRTYCAFTTGKVVTLPQDAPSYVPLYVSSYDISLQGFDDAKHAVAGHKAGVYNNMLRVGWGPFRVFLDQWWGILVRHGIEPAGSDRPYLQLDRSLDDYLVDSESAPLARVFDTLNRNVDHPPTRARRSKFVGYALQYGEFALYQMMLAAGGFDHLAPLGEYPLSTHEAFLMRTDRDPREIEGFYRGQFAAKFLAIMP